MIRSYELHGRFIAFDSESGAVLELDHAAFGALNTPPELHTPEMAEAFEELQTLEREGLFFAKPNEAQSAHKATDMPLKALCMHVSHDCNLRCEYCFAKEGSFGGERVNMTPEIAEKSIDFLLSRCKDRVNLEVDFFGGETLLAFDIVKHTVDYAKRAAPEKNFRFTLTTNGLLLDDDIIEYINSEMDNLVLSLDGRKEINDLYRGKYYDILAPLYEKVRNTRTAESSKFRDFYVRGTYANKNLDFCADVLHLAELGFENISIEPAVLEPGHKLALTAGDLPALFSEYEKLALELSKNPSFSFFHFNVDLEHGPCLHKRLRGCGAGIEYAAISPEGDIYPCHQFVGERAYLMGNVFNQEFSENISNIFAAMDINSREDCRNCYAKYYCGGGCAAQNLKVCGGINRLDGFACELIKKRLDCAIYLKTCQIGEQSSGK